jgi:hypothetical protein
MLREVESEVRRLILEVVLGQSQTATRGSVIADTQFKPATLTAVTCIPQLIFTCLQRPAPSLSTYLSTNFTSLRGIARRMVCFTI